MIANFSMCSDSKLPVLQWGQDPMFNTFNRMYNGDIVNMQEYENIQSDPSDSDCSRAPPKVAVFGYNGHPVWKVDVLGVVVRVEPRDRLIAYSIDDGTGVLNCTHWKKRKEDALNLAHLSSSLQSLHKKLVNVRGQQEEGFALGELVHARGRLKRFRGNVELTASYLAHVEFANMEVVRMMTLPDLYRNCYDKPPSAQSAAAQLDQQINETKKRIIEFLSTSAAPQISMARLETINKSSDPHMTLSELPEGSRISELRSTAVQQVLQDGYIYPKDGERTHFRVVHFDTELFKRIKDILLSEARKQKYREKGCYYMRVLEVLKNSRQFSQLTGAAILRALGHLEGNSEVFSPEYRYYLAMDI